MFTMCIKIKAAACNNSGGVFMKYKRWRAKNVIPTMKTVCISAAWITYSLGIIRN